MADSRQNSSFAFLQPYGPLYLRLATVAERALALDPSLTLVSLRQLSEAFARHAAARAAKSRLERLPAMLEKLKRSILSAAFRGDLTKDWRTAHPEVEPASVLLDRIRTERRSRWDHSLRARGRNPTRATYEEPRRIDASDLPDLPPSWTWASAGQLIDRVESGRSPKAHGRPAEPGEQGVLKVSAVSWGRFLPEENKALVSGDVAEPELLVRRGDLLISRANTVELVGAVVLVEENYPNLMLSDKTLRLVVSDDIDREFLLQAFRTHAVRRIFEDDATGTSDSMRNLSQDKIRGAPIAVAPLDEQREIARLLREATTIIDALGERGEQAEARCRDLEQSALAKAFRGELAAQDPTEESASVLLNRIRDVRASERARPRCGIGQRRDDTAMHEATKVESNSHATKGHHDALDLVVAVFQQIAQRQTAYTLAYATGLTAAVVTKALESLTAGGQVRVHGGPPSVAYEWNS